MSSDDPFADDFDFSQLDQQPLAESTDRALLPAVVAPTATDTSTDDAADESAPPDDGGDEAFAALVDSANRDIGIGDESDQPALIDAMDLVPEEFDAPEDLHDDHPGGGDNGEDDDEIEVEPQIRKVTIIDGPNPVVLPAEPPETRAQARARKSAEKARNRNISIGGDSDVVGEVARVSGATASHPTEEKSKIRKVVIAEDDDPIDLSALPPAGKIDPRVRKRRIAVKRAAGRRRFRLVAVLGVVGVLIAAALVVLASPIFSVKQVEVIGTRYTTAEQLGPIIASVQGEPILTVDPKKIEAQIEALPWVRRSEIDIEFPSTITIRIAERTPAASYKGIDGRWRIIDRSARVIAIETGQPADFLPVAGAGPDLEPGETAGAMIATLAELAEVIGDLPRLDALVIGLSAKGSDLTMTLVSTGGTAVEVILGTASQLRTKLSVLLTLLDNPDLDLDNTLQINLTDPSKPAY